MGYGTMESPQGNGHDIMANLIMTPQIAGIVPAKGSFTEKFSLSQQGTYKTIEDYASIALLLGQTNEANSPASFGCATLTPVFSIAPQGNHQSGPDNLYTNEETEDDFVFTSTINANTTYSCSAQLTSQNQVTVTILPMNQ